jgi:hypothetical protein
MKFDTQEYIKSNLNDFWENTEFKGYKYLDPSQKGMLGEKWIASYLITKGHDVVLPKLNNGPYDLIIDGRKTEVKFGLSHTNNKKGFVKTDTFSINHVSTCKEWDYFLFVGINLTTPKRIAWMAKDDFRDILKYTGKDYFNKQQAGQNNENDDYMSMGKKPLKWIESKYSRPWEEW